MKKKLNILGIILARGGSKGLPNKNIKSFCDRPLLSWTISQALKSNAFKDVVVSTDSKEISKISCKYGAYVPYLRPKELATDDSPSIDSIIHAIDFLAMGHNRLSIIDTSTAGNQPYFNDNYILSYSGEI